MQAWSYKLFALRDVIVYYGITAQYSIMYDLRLKILNCINMCTYFFFGTTFFSLIWGIRS